MNKEVFKKKLDELLITNHPLLGNRERVKRREYEIINKEKEK